MYRTSNEQNFITMKIYTYFLFVCILFCISCDQEEITYAGSKIVVEGDVTTAFLNTGEKRSFTVSALKQKYADGIATDQWVPVSEGGIALSVGEGFELSAISATSFELSAKENQADTLALATLVISIRDGAVTQTEKIGLKQAASEISYVYKIVSEQNPYVIPKEGGEFFIPFTCQSKRTINGKEEGWAYSDMKRLNYVAHTNSGLVINPKGEQVRAHRIQAESTDKTGHYKLHLIASKFYLGEDFWGKDQEFKLFYDIRYEHSEGKEEIYLHQTFSQEQDPSMIPSTLPITNWGPLGI